MVDKEKISTEDISNRATNDIAEKVAAVRERIKIASGAWDETVKIVAVTKTVEEQRINELIKYGISDIAENRAMELARKKEKLDERFILHIIGQIQTNKVKYILNDNFATDMVQSVDRKSIAQALDRRAGMIGIKLPILIQVNVVPEEQKGGVLTEDLEELAVYCSKLGNIKVEGLMWIAPAAEGELIRPYFKKTRRLFDELRNTAINGAEMKWMSMGMSSDYEIAVSEGANMIRLGNALFGGH